uniref:Homologous recombination OB-fold protein OB-fold domain-containing protein n=1 Tax=Tanacetum cinerariifolium TaxID=118510 RepID=A0A699HQP4_TANCI|nr:hypothetical protein [Tanacetum cinerariifolium]
MGVVYVLTTPIPEDGENTTVDQLRRMAKWDNDDYFCIGLILNVMEQYYELLGIIRRFTQDKINMDEAIQVSCIIDKLPPSWKDFKHTLKHIKEDLTLVELENHMRIEESLKVQDNDKPKGNSGGKVDNKANDSGTNGSVDGSTNSLKDDFDLHLTPSLHSSNSTHVESSTLIQNPVTIIPGPAGVVQLSSNIRAEPYPSTSNPVRIIPGPAGIVQEAKLLKEKVFILDTYGALMSTQKYMQKIIEDVGEDNDFNSETYNTLNNASQSHGYGGYGKDITVGVAMILKNVFVFTPKPSVHYLNITMRNVVEVFRKDTVLESGTC